MVHLVKDFLMCIKLFENFSCCRMQCLRVDPITVMESGFVFSPFFFLAHFYNGKDFGTDKTKTHL